MLKPAARSFAAALALAVLAFTGAARAQTPADTLLGDGGICDPLVVKRQ